MQLEKAAVLGPSYEIRPSKATDEGFIAQSWSGSARAALGLRRDSVEALKFGAASHGLISEVLKRATIRVAAPPDDELTIYGFAVFEPGLLHCVYVKRPMRRLGIATRLLQGTGFTLTDLPSRDFDEESPKHIPLVTYSAAMRDFMDRARKVVSLTTKEGGIEFHSAQGRKMVTEVKAGPEVTGLTAMPATEMELDTALGGVVIRYKLRGQATSFLVPMAHIRQMELG